MGLLGNTKRKLGRCNVRGRMDLLGQCVAFSKLLAVPTSIFDNDDDFDVYIGHTLKASAIAAAFEQKKKKKRCPE